MVDIREIFVNACKNKFNFIVKNYGFKNIEISDRSDAVHIVVSSLKNNIGFEIVLDLQDQDIEFLIVRLSSGKLPDGYFVTSEGKVCRVYITELLSKRNANTWLQQQREKGSQRKKRKGEAHVLDQSELEELLEAYAEALKEYGEDLLLDSPTYFE